MTSPTTWVDGAAGSLFDVDNLPYAVFSHGDEPGRVGVRIGDHVLDLAPVAAAEMLEVAHVFEAPGLDPLLALGRAHWAGVGWRACRGRRAEAGGARGGPRPRGQCGRGAAPRRPAAGVIEAAFPGVRWGRLWGPRRAATGVPVVAVQNRYSILRRGDDADVLPLCRKLGVAYAVVRRSPLHQARVGVGDLMLQRAIELIGLGDTAGEHRIRGEVRIIGTRLRTPAPVHPRPAMPAQIDRPRRARPAPSHAADRRPPPPDAARQAGCRRAARIQAAALAVRTGPPA